MIFSMVRIEEENRQNEYFPGRNLFSLLAWHRVRKGKSTAVSFFHAKKFKIALSAKFQDHRLSKKIFERR